MNESETFGAEKEYAEMVIAWMNEEAKKRKKGMNEKEKEEEKQVDS